MRRLPDSSSEPSRSSRASTGAVDSRTGDEIALFVTVPPVPARRGARAGEPLSAAFDSSVADAIGSTSPFPLTIRLFTYLSLHLCSRAAHGNAESEQSTL